MSTYILIYLFVASATWVGFIAFFSAAAAMRGKAVFIVSALAALIWPWLLLAILIGSLLLSAKELEIRAKQRREVK